VTHDAYTLDGMLQGEKGI